MKRLFALLVCVVLLSCAFAQTNLNEELVKAQQLTNVGCEKLNAGDCDGAEKCFLEAIRIDARVREAYIHLNSIYKEKRVEEAVKILESAAKVFYDDDEIWYYLANRYYQVELFNKAIPAYKEAIKYSEINGRDFGLVWSYYFNLANSLARSGKCRESIVFYSKAVELKPENANIYFNRGMNYLMLKLKDSARLDWMKCKELGMEGVDEYIKEYLK
ncbi:tetratricopeptide repeat protein [Carboxylicivirga sp. RSCT41]|uniref:tetratricopeptide repeat protein n=1 Tax=Carboxylicivirga agarovorans TaxID=3417570 RepID=UPI003D34C540